MYGYPVSNGYIGYINGEKWLFSTEEDYVEYYNEHYNGGNLI